MDDTVAAFAKSVNHQNCRIVNTPRLVFLCGGPISEEPDPIQSASARDYFNRHLRNTHTDIYEKVLRAETINDWFRQDTFDDLLELEEHLADLSNIIILFIEGPGSFAELGAFARSDVLRPKTLAIMSSDHMGKKSFIADGPVLRLQHENADLVRSYDWNPQKIDDPSNPAAFQVMSEELVEFLIQRDQDSPKEEQLLLSQDTHKHTMLLLADLINILGITLEKELILCLSEWGLNLNRKQFKKYIYLLDKLNFIEPRVFSAQTYYLSTGHSTFVRYDFVPGTRNRDRDRIKRFFRDTLRTRDPKRAGVFERYLLRKETVAPSHA